MFIRSKKTRDQALNMFTFPYAGGGLNCYRELFGPLEKKGLAVINLELPGRQRMINVPPFTSMVKLVNELVYKIEPLLDQPYIFYGHSMGAWIAYDLVCALHARQRRLPEAVIVSASRSPASAYPELSTLKNTDMLHDWITKLGFPAIHKSLLELLKPALLADVEMVMTRTSSRNERIPVPLHVIYSNEDPVAAYEHVAFWQNLTLMNCHYYSVSGGHFYIYENPSATQSILLNILENKIYIPSSHVTSTHVAAIAQGATA